MDLSESSSEQFNAAVLWGLVVLIAVYVLLEVKDYFGGAPLPEDISRGVKNEVQRSGFDVENQNNSSLANTSAKDKVLSPVEFRSFEVMDMTHVSKDCILFRMKIPNDLNNLPRSIGLPIGRHITVQADIDGSKVMRAYTPCSSPSQQGYFELLIKSYEFGKMSRYLHGLSPGECIRVRGPIGKFNYHANKYRSVGLIAGGTGITPCLQVIRHVLESDPDDHTSFVLFYQNRTMQDILLKNVLDGLLLAYPDRLKIRYFLSNQSSKIPQSAQNVVRGYVSKEIIAEVMDVPRNCQLVCLCGPSGFNAMVKSILVDELGQVENESVHVW